MLMAIGAFVFACLTLGWPNKLPFGENSSFLGLFFKELIKNVILIFATGPLKVYLDVKRGKTSIK